MISTTFGHYRLDEQIGRGGMGEVFRAFDTRLNRPVAVKVMRDAHGGQGVAVQRFLREARAASALNHPNIVTIHEVGETPSGDRFIVQELIEGRTLRAFIGGAMPIATVLDIGCQAARALAAAHAAGVVHRDVKPENIMVRADGYVKVLDFGLARVVEIDPTEHDTTSFIATKPGTVIGTTSYLSPEQARGEAAGPPADIFALGIVLYEMASGRRPFNAPTTVGVAAAIVSEQPVGLSRVNPGVPYPLDVLVHRMLSKEPGHRPTAREVDESLTALQNPGSLAVLSPAPAGDRPTVGRAAERAELQQVYARLKNGRSLILAVSGEPGIGKTSLVEDFLEEIARRPDRPIVARGRCSERLAGAEAYLPILEALDFLLYRTTGETVNNVMRTIAPTWYIQVAHAALEESAVVRARTEAPAASPERMKRELGAFFQEISRAHPVVLFLDDLHWADVSTVDILNYLAGRFADMRLLVLTTYRPADMALAQHPFLTVQNDLRSRGAFEELVLGFLEPADIDRYLAQQFPAHAFPSSFAAMIHGKTDGSPLFMADLVRYLRDSGSIVEDGGTWMLTRPADDALSDLPESVRSMVARKIGQLDEADRKLLIAASVQGHEFDSAIVSEAIGMDAGDVEERLDVLERVHVFVRRGNEYEFPDLTPTLRYQFVHVLYQNVLHASLQPTRRTTLSGRVAKALVKHEGPQAPNIAGRLAVLFESARDFAASAQYFFIAAQRAVGLFAFREALSLAERGLVALRGLAEGPQRIQQELGLQMIRGLALRLMKGWAAPEIEPIFARASDLCRQLEDPPELFPVLWAIALFHAIKGDLREYRQRADELMALAEASGNPAFLMGAHHLVGVSREFLGDMVEASRVLDRGRELHVPSEHLTYTAMYGLDPGIISRAMSSRPLWILGYPDRASARAQETLTLARSQRQPMTLVFALVVMQGIHLYRGEAAQAVAMGDELNALCREYELTQEREWGRSFQGAALAALGRTGEGIDQLKDSLAVQITIGSGLVRTAFLALLADMLRKVQRVDEGLMAVEEGFAHADRTAEGGYRAELHRARAELLRLTGDDAGAEESFRAALTYARDQQAKSFELRAATGLTQLLFSAGRLDEARALLAPLYGWFTEGWDTVDLVEARNTLSNLSRMTND
ncbi:MAG: protein kinase [Acidobacteriota bacterium]